MVVVFFGHDWFYSFSDPPRKLRRVASNDTMKNDDGDDYDAQQQQKLLRREGWRYDALREYELIAVLCNAQSILADAVASSSSSLLGV
jgi:hypothetical protein